MRQAAALLVPLALASCGRSAPAPTETASPAAVPTPAEMPIPTPAATPAPPPPLPLYPPPTPLPPAAPPPPPPNASLDSRDCRTVAQAYADALARRDFAFAARVWNDPVIDAARLRARFSGYRQPKIAIAEVQEEGAAGSLYCTVGGTLTDAAVPSKAAHKGEIVLKRVNDVPGATPEQLRWTIRSSTFVEKMERSDKGAHA